MNNQYNYDYFITKFSAIPDERWTTGTLWRSELGPSCAIGHCSKFHTWWKDNREARALVDIFCGNPTSVAVINDGSDSHYQQPTPKARILAALHDAKARAEAALEQYESRPLKPLSPVLQEQVIATDGPVSCEYLAGSSVAGRKHE